MTPIKVFFCYSREDDILRKGLEKQLKALRRQELIDICYDRDISAGMEWEREIAQHLSTAQVILLLISPDFIDSDYCYGVEMKRAMERHERGEAHVIPIILRPVHWQGTPFGKLQALPTDAKPITGSHWHNMDEAFFDVAEGIRKIIISLLIEQTKALGEEHSSAGEHEKALAIYKQAICITSDDASLYHSKGVVLFDLKRYSEALEAFKQATILDPDNARAFFNIGSILGILKRYKEALIAFDQAILLGLNSAEVYMNKYLALEELHRYVEALATLEQAFELDHKIVVSRSLYVKWAKQLLTLPNLAFLEIDTTGLYQGDEIVRVLLVNNEGNVLFDTFVCADKNISANISIITGITDDDLDNAPAMIHIWESIKQAFTGKHILSFNLDFDQEMLEVTAERYGLEMPSFVGECLMKKAMMYSRSFSYSKLASLCTYIGQPLPKYPHQTALHRAQGQIAVLKAISRGIGIEEPNLEDESDASEYIRRQGSEFTKELVADSRFNKLTKQAVNVLKLAQKEARSFRHKYINTADLLLGLLLESEGIAVKILSNLKIKPKSIYDIIKDKNSYGKLIVDEIGITPQAKKVVEFASKEALDLGHPYVGTEHLLLGLMLQREGTVVGILKRQGISFEIVRDEVLRLYNRCYL